MALLEFLAGAPLAAALCALVLGLLVGSFLNVVVYRPPVMLRRAPPSTSRDLLPAAPTAGAP